MHSSCIAIYVTVRKYIIRTIYVVQIFDKENFWQLNEFL